MKKRNDLGQFTPEIGIKNGQSPISTKYPPEVDKVLRAMSDRSDYIRTAVIEKLIRDGKLTTREP
ncbi:hypothetical protein GS682_04810 [Nostoc sp. B(2019)]|nr:hypothetical protein [Nostoc sp. B(2019)]